MKVSDTGMKLTNAKLPAQAGSLQIKHFKSTFEEVVTQGDLVVTRAQFVATHFSERSKIQKH